MRKIRFTNWWYCKAVRHTRMPILDIEILYYRKEIVFAICGFQIALKWRQ